jgi:hypothetical protein
LWPLWSNDLRWLISTQSAYFPRAGICRGGDCLHPHVEVKSWFVTSGVAYRKMGMRLVAVSVPGRFGGTHLGGIVDAG